MMGTKLMDESHYLKPSFKWLWRELVDNTVIVFEVMVMQCL